MSLVEGYCSSCFNERYNQQQLQAQQAANTEGENNRVLEAKARNIILTTKTAHNLPVAERLDIITAECVIGMHLFKDVASAFRDVFGGRSKAMQEGLREARKTALLELRKEAAAVGADAVVGVDLDYSEISGGGKSMLFLVASGTAVKLQS